MQKFAAKTKLLAILLLFLSLSAASGEREISETALLSHVRFLASDALEGRETGERGDGIAETYIRAQFEQAGLEVAPGMKDYLQEFTVLKSELDRKNTSLIVEDGASEIHFRVDREVFYSLRGHRDLTVRAGIVFAGFGITAPEYDYDDYSGTDVKGKIVLILNHEPGEKTSGPKFRGRAPTRYSNPRVKAGIAKRNGAVGVIVVNDEANGHEDLDVTLMKRYGARMKKPFMSLEDDGDAIPLFYATKPVVRALLQGTGLDIVELQEKIEKKLKPASRSIPKRKIIMNVRIANVVKKHISNLVGYLEGSDPELKSECIIISAHHDHIGSGGGEKIYNGADDNASGTAGLLEIARMVTSTSLSRSLLFVSFCGEEKGVLGSTYFSRNPPIEKIRVVVNLDMIGRNNMDKDENENMFIVFTSAQTPLLEKIVREEARERSLDVRVAPYLSFRGLSDHALFHRNGIPVIFYFSGYHDDYHRETDTVEKIIPSKMKKITGHLWGILPALAGAGGEELLFDRSITEEPPKDKYKKPY